MCLCSCIYHHLPLSHLTAHTAHTSHTLSHTHSHASYGNLSSSRALLGWWCWCTSTVHTVSRQVHHSIVSYARTESSRASGRASEQAGWGWCGVCGVVWWCLTIPSHPTAPLSCVLQCSPLRAVQYFPPPRHLYGCPPPLLSPLRASSVLLLQHSTNFYGREEGAGGLQYEKKAGGVE